MSRSELFCVALGWVALGCVGLGWVGLGWVALGWVLPVTATMNGLRWLPFCAAVRQAGDTYPSSHCGLVNATGVRHSLVGFSRFTA